MGLRARADTLNLSQSGHCLNFCSHQRGRRILGPEMSLKIASKAIRDAVLNGVPEAGPPSLRTRGARLRYRSPSGLNEAFTEAMKIISAEAQTHLDAAQNAPDIKTREMELARSQLHNPEVKYNHLVRNMDMSHPVNKLLSLRDWQRKGMLVLMQRIEQHHMIPDTLPTLDPQADVQLKFVTPNMKTIEPGQWVANDVCSRTPRISIRDYGVPLEKPAKYAVVIVNPDIPDLENDSFTSFLHFAAVNLEASLVSPEPNLKNSLVPYVPPHPEKNAPAQRLCVWVLRQSKDLEIPSLGRESFDIRAFVAQHQLLPVGATLWRSKWDLSSEAVREKYSLGKGRVFFRSRTAHPENSLLHVRERPKWMKVDGLGNV